MTAETCLPNSAYFLADCLYDYSGYEFTGWKVGDTDTILPAGTECRFDAETTLTATWRNDWSDLQAAINAAENGEVIQLENNAVASIYDSALTIPSGKNITLDLNGCTINRGLTDGRTNGQVIINNGTLTITDSAGGGVITGGYGASGSDGGGIANNGTLTLAGGTISGNQAFNSAGGVRNAAGATFTMTGGTISGNTCGAGGGGAVVNYGTMSLSGGAITGNESGNNGGGIWSNGTLTVTGGSITGNTTSDKGAGIYAHGNGTLNLSGSPVITGNSSTGRGSNNLHINQDSNKLPTITAGSFVDGSRIGVSCSVTPTESAPVAIMSGAAGEIAQLVSDSNKYAITYNSGDGKLYLNTALTYTVTAAEDMTLGIVTADPASCYAGDTVTLTITPDEDYALASLTMTPEGGEAQPVERDAETDAYLFTMPAANVTISATFVQAWTSATVQIVWDDDEDAKGIRPDELWIALLDRNRLVGYGWVRAADNWTITQRGLITVLNGEQTRYGIGIDDADLPEGYSLTSNVTEGTVSTLTFSLAQEITVTETENGKIELNKTRAAEGEMVTIAVEPEEGYRLQSLSCTAGEETITLTYDDEDTGTYSFVMPAEAVTVTAVFEEIPTEWELLQGLIDAAGAGETITLTQDYYGDSDDVPLKVVSGQRVTINLNGHTIDAWECEARVCTVNGGELTIEGSGTITGGDASNSVGGAFIVQGGGKLTLNGGTISNNWADNGGGAVAVTGGSFTMNGGEVSDNYSESHGGGVYMQGGTFIMNGGEICINTAEGNGGGLWVGDGATVRITGGSFWNNGAELGEDVYLNKVGLSVSGSPSIGEVYVWSTVITVEDALDESARIGLTCSNSAAANGTVLTNGLTGNGILANFPSVKNGYAAALNGDGEVYLGTARTVTLDLNDGSTNTRQIRVADGTALAEPEAPARDGYAFLGWQLNGAAYDFETPVTEDITLTAQWIGIPPFGTPDFTLPASITSIEDNAFEGAAMTVVSIPDGCESIGDTAFKDCGSLTQIRIPDGCSLGSDVFSGCGLVFVFGTAGSDADAYCAAHGNCVFVAE
jgi:uncharacterized repeat protein (TIGR02543 family)